MARIGAAAGVALGVVALLAPESPTPAPAPLASLDETPAPIAIARIERPEPRPVPAPAKRPPVRRPPQPPTKPASLASEPASLASEPAASRASDPIERPAAPEPRSEPPRAVRPAPRAIAVGESLLRAGSFPRLRATYRRIGFTAYRDAVLALGGAFFLFDATARRPIAEIDPRTGDIRDASAPRPLSRWPRDVTRHLPDALERGRDRYGTRASRVILLPPTSLDAALLGALDAYARSIGLAAGSLIRVDVAYELRDGRLGCEVLSLALADGTERTASLHIDLSGGIHS